MIVIELLLLGAGIWAIVTGKIPSFVFGGTKYKLEGWEARLLGVIFVIPFPTAFAGGIVLALLFGGRTSPFDVLLEVAILVFTVIAAGIVGWFFREPATLPDGGSATVEELIKSSIETEIAKKSQGSLIFALLGILGFSAILVCPLAFFHANQALNLMDRYQIGDQYRGTANAARIIAPIIFLLVIAAGIVLAGIIAWGGF